MAIFFAYFIVVLIWATTPLTIQWSSDSLTFIAAATLRTAFALALGLLINLLLRRKLFATPNVWKTYAVGAIGIFPNMPVVYWSAQFIPSGLVAVMFAMSPFVSGLMMMLLLKQNPFSLQRVLALLLALSGLAIIFYHQLQLNTHAAYGVMGILLSCFLFNFSSVLVKKINTSADAFNQTLGSLTFALPGLIITWLLLDGHIPEVVSTKSWLAISYLTTFGSLLGITLFFYILANLSASTVSLITLMTPVLALLLGALVGGETLTWQLLMGASLVLIALLIYLELSLHVVLLNALRLAWYCNKDKKYRNNTYLSK